MGTIKSDQDWQQELTPEQYRITRQCGTEPPFSGKFYHHHETGTYCCICCHAPLFRSSEKYKSGSGWPSFWAGIDRTAIRELQDHSHGMLRVEIRCAACDAHLGHVFPDGPQPTGLRYCVNSLSLDFLPADTAGPDAQ